MDLLSFTVEMTKALAWPLSAFGISMVFRKQIVVLLSRLKKGKLGPAEVEFDQEVLELKNEAPPAQKDEGTEPLKLPGALRVIAEPRAVILESWLGVETALELLGKKTGLYKGTPPEGLVHLAQTLMMSNQISEEDMRLYRSLRNLRNRAAHESEFAPSVESVLEYARVAGALEQAIRKRANAA